MNMVCKSDSGPDPVWQSVYRYNCRQTNLFVVFESLWRRFPLRNYVRASKRPPEDSGGDELHFDQGFHLPGLPAFLACPGGYHGLPSRTAMMV